MQCRFLARPGVRCGVVRCCVVLCRGEFMSNQRSHLGFAGRIIINSAPLSRAHRSARSAAQRRAVPRGAGPCRAMPVPCRAVRCGTAVRSCAMLLRRAACFLLNFSYIHAKYHSKCHTTSTKPVPIYLQHRKEARIAKKFKSC